MWRCILPFAAVLLAAPIAGAQTNPQYNTTNFHTYVLTPTTVAMTWQQARDYARTLGGYLVSINDAAENAFVDGRYTNTIGVRRWIGLSDAASEGVFVWDSGEPVTYTAWGSGEPSNSGNEDYVEIIGATGPAFWNDNTSPPFGAGPMTAVIEMPYGDRVNFEGHPASCSPAFPTPLGTAGDSEGVSWNGAGGTARPATVTDVVSAGFPVEGSKYLRLYANGPIAQPLGGPFARPTSGVVNEVRIRVPPGAKGVSFAWEFHCAENQNAAGFNDGMSIAIVNQSGLLIQDLVYADTSFTQQTGGMLTLCGLATTTPIEGPGPQERSALLPPLPANAYLSILCWNGGDNLYPSAAHVDAIHFWGYGNFKLNVTAPFGAGSIRLQNVNGASGNVYWTPVTFSQGSFPNDWFYGIDISANDLVNEVLSGPPFSGNLGAAGSSTFTIPSGVPGGIHLYAVSLRFANGVAPFGQGFIEASAPEDFITQ